jgi:hypothetical protein
VAGLMMTAEAAIVEARPEKKAKDGKKSIAADAEEEEAEEELFGTF